MREYFKNLNLFLRILRDKHSTAFHTAPLWLVVKINSEYGDLKRKLLFQKLPDRQWE